MNKYSIFETVIKKYINTTRSDESGSGSDDFILEDSDTTQLSELLAQWWDEKYDVGNDNGSLDEIVTKLTPEYAEEFFLETYPESEEATKLFSI